MTPRKPRGELQEVVRRSARRLEAEGRIARVERQGPCKPLKFTPGHSRIPVAIQRPDGSSVDVDGARRLLADRPYAARLAYVGSAQGRLWFEYAPETTP